MVALRAALQQDGKMCPQMSLACCLGRKGPDKAELEMAVGLAKRVVDEARTASKAAQRDKWHAWITE